MTVLCVSIFVHDAAEATRDAVLAAERGADMVEYRIDTVSDAEMVRELVRRSPLPCIVTCRPTWEGGRSDAADSERFALLQAAADAGAAYVDLELEAQQQTAGTPTGRIILSSHDFRGRPDRLYNLLAQMNAAGCDVCKLVWTARTIRDNLEVFEILQHRQRPTIGLCMGEAGLISRVLARKFGAFLTFASLETGASTAPGQISVQQMKSLYRWEKIGPATRVYGVVADPVKHSMSPAIHNAAFDATHFDGVYLPMLVEGSYESFKAFIESFLAFGDLHLSGLSITIPHKTNALRYLQEKNATVEPLALRIGAVNTIIVENGGAGLRGINTDYAAILDAITAKLNITREQLAGRGVGVIGAGGTGRTAVAAMAHYGASVTVFNRTLERAETLAMEFHGRSGSVAAAPMEALDSSRCAMYINTTSVGMYPKAEDSPWPNVPARLPEGTLVFDTIYNPIETRLLREAKAAGALTIGGIEMFVRQAAAQFEAWTRQPAPTDVMRQVIEQRLRSI